MGVRGLQWQTMSIPLGVGLNQRGDRRAGDPPFLDICTDAAFDALGGLQTRPPFGVLSNATADGGTLSDCRKLSVNGDELIVFTKDKLYSWSPERAVWVERATHLACKVTETPVFITTGDQYECDRAQLSGVVVYAWREVGAGLDQIKAAAVDATSGSVIVAPTVITGGASRPRVVATSTKILLFTSATAAPYGLTVRAIDPAAPATGFASAGSILLAGGSVGDHYDAVKVPGADSAIYVARRSGGASYDVGLVTAGLSVTTVTKARTTSGPIAVTVSPDGLRAQVARNYESGGFYGIKGDLLDAATLADVFTGTTIADTTTSGPGTIWWLTTAYRSVKNGDDEWPAYVYWYDSGAGAAFGSVSVNWIDTSNAIGTAASVAKSVTLASRAFDRDGVVYVNASFAGTSNFVGGNLYGYRAQLQNTYFLLASDGSPVAKVAPNYADAPQTHGHLPGVALVDAETYAWCGGERRIINLGGDATGYGDRGPRDVVYTFDSNEARRTARLGATLYIAGGGETLQYDRNSISEVGFNWYPYQFAAFETFASGSVDAGDFAIKCTYRAQNAQGERERSTTATVGGVTVAAAGTSSIDIAGISCLNVTHRPVESIAIEVWRTAKDPTSDAPFYLSTSTDPSSADFIVNSANDLSASFSDTLADADLILRETNPENGGILECLAPPASSIIAANQDRLFLAGIPGQPDRVVYSRLRGDGEVASFHDSLTIAVPQQGGAITGLAFLNETLIVFRETAIYAFAGDGYANDGSGTNYGPARALSTDIGALNAESIATIHDGSLLFKSSKGWHVLNRGWAVDYIGAPVVDYDAETPLAVCVLTSKQQVRITTAERMLVWDYVANQWSQWTFTPASDAVVWAGVHHALSANTVYAESDGAAINFGMDIETAWIKLGDIQGLGRVRRILILGEYLSSCALRVRIARDYKATSESDWQYFDDRYWDVTPTTVGGTFQLRIGPSQQQCEAIKIRITVVGPAPGHAAPTGLSIKLSGLALEVGSKRGPYPMLPSTQKI